MLPEAQDKMLQAAYFWTVTACVFSPSHHRTRIKDSHIYKDVRNLIENSRKSKDTKPKVELNRNTMQFLNYTADSASSFR